MKLLTAGQSPTENLETCKTFAFRTNFDSIERRFELLESLWSIAIIWGSVLTSTPTEILFSWITLRWSIYSLLGSNYEAWLGSIKSAAWPLRSITTISVEYKTSCYTGEVSPSDVDFTLLGKRVNTEIYELLREPKLTGISQTESIHMIRTLPTNGKRTSKRRNDDREEEMPAPG